MMLTRLAGHVSKVALFALALGAATTTLPQEGSAQVTAFKQAVAETGARDDAIAKFYRQQDFEGIWIGTEDLHRQRRSALLDALRRAGDHGLPVARYDADKLERQMAAVRSPRDLGQVEVEMTRLYLQYARDLQSGALIPSKVVSAIKREVSYTDRAELLRGFMEGQPASYLRDLAPRTIEYGALMK